MLPHQGFEVARLSRKGMLYGLQGCLKGDRDKRVTVVEPGRQSLQHHEEPARVTSCVLLAQLEFDRVHGCRDCLSIDALLGNSTKCVEDECLNLVDGLGRDTFEPYREVELSDGVIHALTDDVFAQSRIDQRLAQRTGGRPNERMGQNAQRQC